MDGGTKYESISKLMPLIEWPKCFMTIFYLLLIHQIFFCIMEHRIIPRVMLV